MISLFFSPFLMFFLYFFRAATQMTVGWNIPQHDMFFYALFICVVLPFMMFIDVIIINIKELTHFWKMYDYLQYLQLRFSQRREWWQMHAGADGDMDMGVPRKARSLDHMAFSGQYYFMLLVHTGGMVCLIVGLETCIHNAYNPFNDLVALFILSVTVAACVLLERSSLLIAHTLRLWPLPPKRSRLYVEQQYRGDTGIIPSWEQGYIEQIDKLKRSQWYSEEGMRTLPFKQRWIKLNKDWVIDQLIGIWKNSQLPSSPKAVDTAPEAEPFGEWLSTWGGDGSRDALLERIARALGLEEQWERYDAQDEAAMYGDASAYRERAQEAGRGDAGTDDVDPSVEADRDGDGDAATPRSVQDEDAGFLSPSRPTNRDPLSPSIRGPLSPSFRPRPTTRAGRGATTRGGPASQTSRVAASRHRAHLLSLCYRFLLSRYSHTCGVCQRMQAGDESTVVQLRVPLKTIIRRWYAKRRREAAITARMEGQGAVDRKRVYCPVTKKEWRAWMEEEEDWRSLCADCLQDEKDRWEREGGEEGDDGDLVVVDVLAYALRERERKERLQAEGQEAELSSDTDDTAATPSPAHPSSDDEEAAGPPLALYSHPAVRGEDTARTGEGQATASARKDYLDGISDDSDEAGAEEQKRPVPGTDISPDHSGDESSDGSRVIAPARRRVSVSDDSSTHDSSQGLSSRSISSVKAEMRAEEARHGVVGLGRVEVSDDSDEGEEAKEGAASGQAGGPGRRRLQPPEGGVEVSDDSEEEGGQGGERIGRVVVAPVGREGEVSDDSDEGGEGERRGLAFGQQPPVQREDAGE